VSERPPSPRYCQVCGHYLVERRVAAEDRTRLQCESCGFIHYLNPRVVAAAIVHRGDNVLLQQRAVEPRAGFWTFPGGFLEFGETPREAAARETLEEVCLRVAPGDLLGVYTRPDAGIVLIVYDAESREGEAAVGDFESRQVRWFATGDIPWDELAFDTTIAALRDWVARR
jgi:ADP-ribose pyrophosphatase YjhB (NUDIX family)